MAGAQEDKVLRAYPRGEFSDLSLTTMDRLWRSCS